MVVNLWFSDISLWSWFCNHLPFTKLLYVTPLALGFKCQPVGQVFSLVSKMQIKMLVSDIGVVGCLTQLWRLLLASH